MTTDSLIEPVLIGLLQGLLEWLPISSSGQLSLILTQILGISPAIAYRLSIASHLGTGLSGVVILRKELLRALRDLKLLEIIILPVIVGAPIALLLEKQITNLQGDLFNLMIGALLLTTAFIVYKARSGGGRKLEDLTLIDLIILGIAQGLAALPGLSRSGITIAVLLLRNMDPIDAVKASFLTGIAATGAAALYELISYNFEYWNTAMATALMLSSLSAGLLSAKSMLILAQKYNKEITIFAAIIGVLAIISAIPAFL
ncbi:MAG: undecaprenyl-diphosphate phosphatase [Desulfurococcales archaeon]|nr:undecaprenyl-diphosphate phosphatase [Desulfurococcales archaeon]